MATTFSNSYPTDRCVGCAYRDELTKRSSGFGYSWVECRQVGSLWGRPDDSSKETACREFVPDATLVEFLRILEEKLEA